MKYFLHLVTLLILSAPSVAQDTTAYTQQEVIYGRKDGMALSMVALLPVKKNGRGIISLVSGNWVSGINGIQGFMRRSKLYLDNGYTVFLVMHGSGPRYAIPDAIADVKRAVRYIRYNAAAYKISPEYIGITGASSGGHLSLMAGTTGDAGNAKSSDPVERESSKVQAVAVFFPPTDFLNYGQLTYNPVAQRQLLQLRGILGAFEFKEWDSLRRVYTVVEDTARQRLITRSISPAQQVTDDDAPAYIIHGDADVVVPLQQSQVIQKRLEAVKVPVALRVKQGGSHGWQTMGEDEKDFITWFDKYLKVK